MGQDRRRGVAGDGAGPGVFSRGAALSGQRADCRCRQGIDWMQLPTGASRFVFIFAHPAGHVGAPRYYSPYFRERGLDWHMVPLDVAPNNWPTCCALLANSTTASASNSTMRPSPPPLTLVTPSDQPPHSK